MPCGITFCLSPHLARRSTMRRHTFLGFFMGCLVLLGANRAEPTALSFKEAKVGGLPKGWTATKTGKGEGSVWKIVEDDTSPDGGKALAQVSPDGPNPLFNLCVADEPKVADVDLTVAFKPIAGKRDQGGGPVWRYQDANNYYVCRMNPL